MSAEDRPVWERQKGETPRAYAAFSAYRDAGPIDRGIAKCCRKATGDNFSLAKLRNWEKWSPKYDWVKRADAWDYEVDRISREADLKAIAEMRENHIKEARALQAAGSTALQKLIEKMRSTKRDLSPSLILQFIIQGAAMERTARGEPGSIFKEVDKDGILELIWSGPPITNPDATASRGPVGGEEEQGKV